MSFRSSVAVRLFVPALLLPLAACGPARNAFAPLCPTPRLIPALADVTRYSGPGPTHDVTDLVLQARVVAVNGSCSAGDDTSRLPAKVQVSISILRGPAMKDRDADVPVFLAVTQGDEVRDKKVFPLHLTFPPNVDRLTITSPAIDMDLPISSSTSGAAYSIIAGFQLSPDELAANRQGGGS
ncbi:MAG: hypothetical protein QOH05_4114 [Acetobacteraceae bacterium]|jgi:hypothetical protein|nr:hypothetical protein [Acetobacteraceae bacterium]